MKKAFLLSVLLTACMGIRAQYTQTLPLNYTDFFRADAINADGEHLEAGEYAEGAAQNSEGSPILSNQWSLSAKGGLNSQRGLSNPAVVVNDLSWGNYIDNAKGKAVVYDGTADGLRVSIYGLKSNNTYSSSDASKSYYLSALVNFSKVSSTNGADFLAFDGNYTANTMRGRVYVKKGGSSSKFHIGMGYSDAPETWSSELTCGETHLLVLKITPNTNKGTNDEAAELWLDPDLSKSEAENVDSRIVSVIGNGIASVRGINIVQRKNVTGKIAGLRFSDNWADVVKSEPLAPVADADRVETDFNDGTWGEVATSAYTSGSFPSSTINGLTLNAAGLQNGSKTYEATSVKYTNRISMDYAANGGMITLPALSSVDKIVVYASAGSENRQMKLQKYDYDKGEWMNVETWSFASTDCYRFEKIFNSNEVTKLRLINADSSGKYIWKIITYPVVTLDRISTNFSDATIWGTPAQDAYKDNFPSSEVDGFILTKAGLENKSVIGPAGEAFTPRISIDKKSYGGMIILPAVTSVARVDMYVSVGGANPKFTLDAYNYNTDNWTTLEEYTIESTNTCYRFSKVLNSNEVTKLRIANADGSAKYIWKIVTYPTAPTDLAVPEALAAANIGVNSFTARWNTVANASGYRIVVFNSDASRRTKEVTGGNIFQYNITGLDADANYTYKVAAIGDDENYVDSYLSDAVAVRTSAAIADSYTRTVTNGNYGTICLPKASGDLSAAGAVFFEVAGKVMDDSSLKEVVLDEVDALEAGKPYVFLASASELNIPLTGEAETDPDNSSSNGLMGSFEVAKVGSSVYNFILSNNKLYCTKDKEYYVGENRAYFRIEDMSEFGGGNPAPGRRRVHMGTEGYQTPTGLEDVVAAPKATKQLIDGKMVIIRNGEMYDLTGKRVL